MPVCDDDDDVDNNNRQPEQHCVLDTPKSQCCGLSLFSDFHSQCLETHLSFGFLVWLG